MSKIKTTVSVVIPLYNKSQTIIETLCSVFSQTVAADEVIIVDDGSTDDSYEKVYSHFKNSVRIIYQKNSGVSAARNRGVKAATSDYIAFLDGDDLWSPHFLEEIHRLINKYPKSGVLATRYQYISGGNVFYNPKIRFNSHFFFDNYLREGILDSYFSIASRGDLPFNSSTVAMKKSLLISLNGFPENEPMGEDQDVWARASLASTIAYSPRVLAFYNLAPADRACTQLPPKTECPFSKRLYQFALHCDDQLLAKQIIDYTAAHIRHLAVKNIDNGQYETAKFLLGDVRCSSNRFKKYRIVLVLMHKQLNRALNKKISNYKKTAMKKMELAISYFNDLKIEA